MDNEIKQDLDSLVNEISLVTRTSKAGKPYSLMQITLSNGLDIEFFPERAETKILQLMLKQGAQK